MRNRLPCFLNIISDTTLEIKFFFVVVYQFPSITWIIRTTYMNITLYHNYIFQNSNPYFVFF